ncbi:MAG: hypothetical protein M0R06_01475 [Sphaerochaeta sp.]|jgi:hypothetical protein|nr:hypothetical protein [Sphaerochaeta sp.]
MNPWWKKLRSWLWIIGSALIGAVVDGTGNGLINYVSSSNGTINWRNLIGSMMLGVFLSVGNLMIHSPRHEGGTR